MHARHQDGFDKAESEEQERETERNRTPETLSSSASATRCVIMGNPLLSGPSSFLVTKSHSAQGLYISTEDARSSYKAARQGVWPYSRELNHTPWPTTAFQAVPVECGLLPGSIAHALDRTKETLPNRQVYMHWTANYFVSPWNLDTTSL